MAKQESEYIIKIRGDASDLQKTIASVSSSMDTAFGGKMSKGLTTELNKAAQAITTLQTKADEPLISQQTIKAMDSSLESLRSILASISGEIQQILGLSTGKKLDFLPDDEGKKLKELNGSIKEAEKAYDGAEKAAAKLTKEEEKQVANLKRRKEDLQIKRESTIASQQEAASTRETVKKKIEEVEALQKTAQAARENADQVRKLADEKKKADSSVDLRKEKFDGGNGQQMTVASSEAAAKSAEAAYATALEKLPQLQAEYKAAEADVQSYGKSLATLERQLRTVNSELDAHQKKLATLQQDAGTQETEAKAEAFRQLKQALDEAGIAVDGVAEGDLEGLKSALDAAISEAVVPFDEKLRETQTGLEQVGEQSRTASEDVRLFGEETKRSNEAQGDVSNIINRLKAFTGLTGGMMVLRRTMRAAIQSTKELDEQMTQMAVVTNFRVGDFWEQMPQHTEAANKLGIAIKDVYEAETLYYQQGLKTAQVQQVANSTLKMARIAGLSAEEATNKMTAALRGFNMEVNQTNADRVADVYSKLAAITASDVNEISSAMTKTASIAANAGMQFETTAAFLSQIIETTRESAETAGTALKTVIARFQELKKSPDEIGEVEGEVVDANKIETALKTVGIALRDAKGQFRELDDVFLELSGKWDSLDTNTQRYIATIAAGSRQQSRFIAMMSNNVRTQELVQAANTAAGASNEQFGKTLDSLESKLAKLKNGWTEFTQGLMNNQFIKLAVDALTKMLSGLNAITKGFGTWSGSALKIGLVTTALIGATKAFDAFRASMAAGNGLLKSIGTGLAAPIKGLKDLAKKGFAAAVQQGNGFVKTLKYLKEEKGAFSNFDKAKSDLAFATKGTQEYIDAQEKLTKSTKEISSAFAFSNEQQKAFSELTDMGIDSQNAAILATKGYNKELLESQFAKAADEGATDAQTAAQYGNTIATNTNTQATKKGLRARLKDIAGKIAQTASNIATSISEAALAFTTWLANAALWAQVLVIIALVAVVAGIIIGIMALCGAFNQEERELEKANEQLTAAKDSANAASEAYNNLKESLQSINDKYTELENMTAGTQEWRDAVFEVNQQVLDLIDKYPELASEVENVNGILKLNKDAQQKILDKQYDSMVQAQNAQLAAQMGVYSAEQNLERSNLSRSTSAGSSNAGAGAIIGLVAGGPLGAAIGAIVGATIYDIDKETTDTMAKELLEIDKVTAMKKYNLTEEAYDELREYGKNLAKWEQQTNTAMRQMISNSVSLLDTTKYTAKELDAMRNVGISAMEKAQAEAEKKLKGRKDFDTNSAYKAYWQSLYPGAKVEVDDDGSVKITGGTDNVDIKLTKEQAISQYASVDASEQLSKALEKLPKALEQIDRQFGNKSFSRLMSNDAGKGMTRSDIANMRGQNLEELWRDNQDTFQAIYGDFETFQAEMTKRMTEANEQFDRNREQLTKIHLENIDFGNISAEAEQGLTKHLTEAFNLVGQEGTKELGESLDAYLEQFSDEEAEKISSAISASDWRNLDELKSLPETFLSLGLSLEGLDGIIQSISETVNATRKVDLGKSQDNLFTLTKLNQNIRKGEQGRTLSDEEYNALIAIVPDLKNSFLKTANGMTFIGSSMYDLQQAIEANTQAIISDEQGKLQSKLNTSKILNKEEFNEYYNQGSKAAQQEYLVALQKYMNENNMSYAGFEHFTSDTPIMELKEESIKQIMDELKPLIDDATVRGLEQQSRDLVIQSIANSVAHKDLETLTSSNVVQNASRLQNNQTDEVNKYMGYNKQIMATAAANGTPEVTLRKMGKMAKELDEMVRKGEVGTRKWKETTERYAAEAQSVGSPTSYKDMKEKLTGAYSAVKELNNKLFNADTIEDKLSILRQQASQFGLKVTEDNMGYINELMHGFLTGSEKSFEAIINEAGYELNGLTNAYGQVIGKNIETLNEKQREVAEFLRDTNLAYIDLNGKLQVDLAVTKDLVKQTRQEMNWWRNSYDWLWNSNKRLEQSYYMLQKAETRLTDAMEEGTISTEKSTKALNEIAQRITVQTGLEAMKAQNLDKELAVKADQVNQLGQRMGIGDLVHWDAENGLTVNSEGLDKAKVDEGIGGLVDQGIGEITSLLDEYNNTQDKIYEDTKKLKELQNKGKEEYKQLVDRIGAAMEQRAQREIDVMSQINESIQSVQESILSQMQENIAQQRQDRENEKTEQELTDKRSQLAYLQGGGGSELDILKMTKEITDAQQSYEDSLIDQQISEMEKANQKAADQRQEQIDIAQAQLNWWSTYQKNHDAEQRVLEASARGWDTYLPDLGTSVNSLLHAEELVDAMSTIDQKEWNITQQSVTDLSEKFAEVHASEISDMLTAQGQISSNTSQALTKLASLASIEGTWSNTINQSVAAATSIEKNAWEAYKLSEYGAKELVKGTDLRSLSSAWETTVSTQFGSLVTSFNTFSNAYKLTDSHIKNLQDWWDKDVKDAFEKFREKLDLIAGAIDPEKQRQALLKTRVNNAKVTGDNLKAIYDADLQSQKIDNEKINGTLKEGLDSGYVEQGKWYDNGEQYVKYNGKDWEGIYKTDLPDMPQNKVNSALAGKGKRQIEKRLSEEDIKNISDLFIKYGVHGETNDSFIQYAWVPARANQVDSNDKYIDAIKAFTNTSELQKDAIRNKVNKEYLDMNIIPAYGLDSLTSTELKLTHLQEERIRSLIKQSKQDSGIISINSNPYSFKLVGDQIELSWDRTSQGYAYKTIRFATGGLADFTGPAWLDGTSTRPELVLNATDTANFIQLKDILASLAAKTKLNSIYSSISSSSDTTPGNLYYDIDVNIDDLQAGDINESVERISESIQRHIEELASYRNVNVVNNFR